MRVWLCKGKQPDVMEFYIGCDGVNMSKNSLSHLNTSSPFDGSVRRWYCRGACSGRFATVFIPSSTLATLKGCLMRMYLWFRKLLLLLWLCTKPSQSTTGQRDRYAPETLREYLKKVVSNVYNHACIVPPQSSKCSASSMRCFAAFSTVGVDPFIHLVRALKRTLTSSPPSSQKLVGHDKLAALDVMRY